ncbi:MAG: homoserine dehydrogenase [Oscillospiraceae bacterium]|nr:homoserine dehydrogenase [Oscillospiraceae bacterium]
MIKIGLLGHGVVGTGVVDVISNKAQQLFEQTGETVEIKSILVRHDYDVDYKEKFVYDFADILADEEISIVVEAIGGTDPAYKYVKSALEAGKSVVTSNKELVAKHGFELMNIAEEKNINFIFEAAVGGAIPVIHGVRNCLKANKVNSIAGILNGTTNYILTKMIDEKQSFDVALKAAQELGYAEADPSADVDGIDTCRKICILADIVFGNHILPENVHTEGIRNVRIEDVDILKTVGGAIKLLGVAKRTEDDRLLIMTAPHVVFNQGILFAANDVFNAAQLETDNAGLMAFYGRGAGSLPTASAVVNDIVECICSEGTLYPAWGDEKPEAVADYKSVPMQFYVNVKDNAEKVKTVFENSDIVCTAEETAFITEKITENRLTEKLNGFTVNSVLRVL